MMSDLYVAKTSAVVKLGGERHWIRKGLTVARSGHPIMDGREAMFEPLRVHYDTVEQATAAPGEKRDLELPDTKAIRKWAAERGYDVPPRGRLPESVLQAYREAQE